MKITNENIYDIEESVKASGYPMMSEIDYILNDGDYSRAEKLAKNKPGTGHNNFLKGITVQFDLKASQYIWLQAERYHWFEPVSMQSKMHRITRMRIDKQCNKYVLPINIRVLQNLINFYNRTIPSDFPTGTYLLEDLPIPKSFGNQKELFQTIISNTPMGLMLTARITTNYLQLKTIYHQRKNHKLEEWDKFCEWVEDLPHSEWITDNGS